MQRLPEIHLAILTYDALDHTKACLETLRRFTRMPYRVHVWDNASKPETREYLEQAAANWDALDVRFSPTNRGVAGGRNELLNWLLPEIPDDAWLVFLDNDITVGPDWTSPFEDLLERHPDAGMMGHAGHPIVVGEGSRGLLPMPPRTAPVDVLSGGFACWIRAGVARAIGALDEGTGKFWHEDDDWSIRAKAAGHSVWRVAGADITHHEHASGVADAGLAEGGSLENQAYLTKKWRDHGWVDSEGWVQHPEPLHGLDAGARDRIARRCGRPDGLDRNDVAWVQGDLDTLLTAEDPTSTPEELELPWTPLHTAMLEEIATQSRCAETRGRAAWLLEQHPLDSTESTSSKGPGRPADPLRICGPADWHDPAFRRHVDDLRIPLLKGLWNGSLDRRDWEQAVVLQALEAAEMVRRDRSLLIVGGAYLPFTYRLAQECGLVVALDPDQQRLGDLDENDTKTAPSIQDELARRATCPFPEGHLRILESDLMSLTIPVESFHGAACRLFSSQSAQQQANVLTRVASLVKPGGVITCIVDIEENAAPRGSATRSEGSGWPHASLARELVHASGLHWPGGDSTGNQGNGASDWCVTPSMAAAGRPHLSERGETGVTTSALLVLHKPVTGWHPTAPSGNRKAEPAPIAAINRSQPLIPAQPAGTPPPAHIGWDARTLQYVDSVSRGIGHYTLHHLEAVLGQAPGWRFTLFGEGEPPAILKQLLDLPQVRWQSLNDYRPGIVDLIHLPDPMNLLTGFDAPFRVFRESHSTVLFHDLIPYHLYWQQWPDEQRAVYRSRLQQMTDAGAVALTNSAFTARDLVTTVGFPADRAFPVLAGLNQSDLAPDPDRRFRTLQRHGLDRPFFLYVGAGELHKNIATSLGAYQEACTTHDAQFVLAGRLTGQLKTLYERCRERGMDGVVATDFIPREELEDLYSAATATVFMSRMEGFGFPVLEAMARGCPVICSTAASLPEVAGDAAIQLNPDDEPGVAGAMRRLLEDPDLRHRLAERGKAQAAQFTWDAVAERTLRAWAAMLGGSARPTRTEPASCIPGHPVG